VKQIGKLLSFVLFLYHHDAGLNETKRKIIPLPSEMERKVKHLTEMVEQHKRGNSNGIYAVCSAHPLVLEAAIRYAHSHQTPLLIEATSNQVDQFGGYTGMTPADFHGLSASWPSRSVFRRHS
jgi:hypothetical protein